MMRAGLWTVAGGLALMGVLTSCDSGPDQDQFENEAFSEPSGFTRTSESGDVLEVDPDDWRLSPAYFERLVIDPAFPNPVPAGATVSIPVRVRLTDSIQGGLELVSYDEDGIPRRLAAVPNARDPGAYVLRFSASLLHTSGLVRVFIVDTAGGLVSYGDLQVE